MPDEKFGTVKSWWISVPREQWLANVEAELPRIRTSKFAKWSYTNDFSESYGRSAKQPTGD